MPSEKKSRPAPSRSAASPAVPAKPLPPPLKRFLVRCTFAGEDKKKRVEGSFRFVLEAADADAVRPKLEAAVKKLRRTAELPSRCDVYVEFILELVDLPRGLIVDFECWEKEPKRFERGYITFAENCPVYHTGEGEPVLRFGQPAAKPPAA